MTGSQGGKSQYVARYSGCRCCPPPPGFRGRPFRWREGRAIAQDSPMPRPALRMRHRPMARPSKKTGPAAAKKRARPATLKTPVHIPAHGKHPAKETRVAFHSVPQGSPPPTSSENTDTCPLRVAKKLGVLEGKSGRGGEDDPPHGPKQGQSAMPSAAGQPAVPGRRRGQYPQEKERQQDRKGADAR